MAISRSFKMRPTKPPKFPCNDCGIDVRAHLRKMDLIDKELRAFGRELQMRLAKAKG